MKYLHTNFLFPFFHDLPVYSACLGLVSENLAIDDALYYLEQALSSSENAFDIQGFLAESKSLSRQQFICKAQLHKIHGTVCGFK